MADATCLRFVVRGRPGNDRLVDSRHKHRFCKCRTRDLPDRPEALSNGGLRLRGNNGGLHLCQHSSCSSGRRPRSGSGNLGHQSVSGPHRGGHLATCVCQANNASVSFRARHVNQIDHASQQRPRQQATRWHASGRVAHDWHIARRGYLDPFPGTC